MERLLIPVVFALVSERCAIFVNCVVVFLPFSPPEKNVWSSSMHIFSVPSDRIQTCATKKHFKRLVTQKTKRTKQNNKNPLSLIFPQTRLSHHTQSREKRGCQRKPCRASSSERKEPHSLFLPSLTSIPAARSVQAPQGTDVT